LKDPLWQILLANFHARYSMILRGSYEESSCQF